MLNNLKHFIEIHCRSYITIIKYHNFLVLIILKFLSLAMRPLTAAYLLVIILPIESGVFEDAKDLVSSFKSVVDLPLSKDFEKTHRFIALTMPFLRRAVPFGELLATALKVGIEEDQLGALLELTNGIDAKVKDIARQQKYIETSVVYRDLLIDYRTNVGRVIDAFLQKIRTMSLLKMNVTQPVIDSFVSECNSIRNSPETVAQYLAILVSDCAEPNLPHTPVVQLFGLIDKIQFFKYELTTDEQHLFSQRFGILYFWLSSHPTESSVFAKFAEDRRGIYVYNKLVLIDLLMEELGIEESDRTDTLCLPKAAFVAHGYKHDAVERFGDLLMENLLSLEYVTVLCANITFYDNQGAAEVYTSEVKRILKPVYSFISNWFNDLLESTWPTTEAHLIQNIMQDTSKGALFAETNETYEQIVNVVHEKMKLIGHPSYKRQYVATRQRSTDFNSKDFTFECRARACTNSSSSNAHVISIRTRTDNNKVYESLQDLIEFRNSSWPSFLRAMDSELYRYNYVKRAIQVLGEKYGLDLNVFANHSSYIVLREDLYRAGCSNQFALKSDEDLDNSFLQVLHYHEDGTKFTDCEDWINQFCIFDGVVRVVDLCAAPGSWSQVLSKTLFVDEKDEEKRKMVKIVAVDLQPMAPLPGVIQLQGDITESGTAQQIIAHFDGALAQLVVCDGAPDVTGLHAFDEYMQSQLVFSAFSITSHILQHGGIFVSKIFRAKNVNLLYAQMKCFFKEVTCCKPKSSRQSSCEAFIVCKNYCPPEGYKPTLVNPILATDYSACLEQLEGPMNKALVPFMACGDLSGFDSDRTYPLNLAELSDEFKQFDYKYTHRDVLQPPTEPAYKRACELKRNTELETHTHQQRQKTQSKKPAKSGKSMEVAQSDVIDEFEEGCFERLML